MRNIRSRLTYANVASSLALFLAVSGGTAFAAATIGSSQIKSGAVTNSKIASGAVSNSKLASNAVTGSKIKAGTITGSDIASNTITSANIQNGSLQASDFASGQLPAGPAGPAGPGASLNGVVGPTGTLEYGSGVAAVSVGGAGVYTVTFTKNVSQCPAVATIGGYQIGGSTASGSNGGTVSLQPGGNNNPTAAQQITFITRDLNGVNAPLPFHFGVFC